LFTAIALQVDGIIH